MTSPRFIPAAADVFPEPLRHVRPEVDGLWALGPDPTDERAVAVVGTRRATPYGLEIARALGRDLALADVAVVSGLATGIDAAAHVGALAAGGRTIAVVAGGVDVPMPPRNRSLYREILASGGTVLSEQPPGAPSLRPRYLERNRIIAGLAAGVVVVQAGYRSGARNTANWALDFGRDLFAVPGDVRADVSQGVHDLLRHHAFVCTGVRDVLDVLGWTTRGRDADEAETPAEPQSQGTPRDPAAVVLAALDAKPVLLEEVAARAHLDMVTTLRALGALEFDGLVNHSGARYTRAPATRDPAT